MDVAALGLWGQEESARSERSGIADEEAHPKSQCQCTPEGVVSLRHGVGAEGIRTFSASFMDDLVVNRSTPATSQ